MQVVLFNGHKMVVVFADQAIVSQICISHKLLILFQFISFIMAALCKRGHYIFAM